MIMKQSRSRALDTSRPLPIHRQETLNDVDIQPGRGIQYVFTGMEKAEEEEKHLQEILTAQVLGLQKHHEDLVIPTPEFNTVPDYTKLYKEGTRKPGQYIHAQPFFHEDYPVYDMDEEDAKFLCEEIRGRWMLQLTETAFEEMISQFEMNSGGSVITIEDAKLIMNEDDDLILLVYEYWLTKKLRLKHNLVPTVRAENVQSGQDKNNPYVAFRRRFEKMQTRKNRKLDENSYAVMLKLKRDFTRAVTLLSFVKKRERLKKARLEASLDILEKRVNAEDWDSRMLNEINAVQKYKQFEAEAAETPALSSDDDQHSMADSDYESDEGPFAFRRKQGARYVAPLTFSDVNDSATNSYCRSSIENDESLHLSKFSPSVHCFVWTHVPGVCVCYARRRVGRGGRVIIDRMPPVRNFNQRLGHSCHNNADSSWIAASDEGQSKQSLCAALDRPVEPLVPRNLEEPDIWDPYKVTQKRVFHAKSDKTFVGGSRSIKTNSEDAAKTTWRKRYGSGGMKTINMDRVGAHNAASAVINAQFIDLFSVGAANERESIDAAQRQTE